MYCDHGTCYHKSNGVVKELFASHRKQIVRRVETSDRL
jgi:hypothetical protein